LGINQLMLFLPDPVRSRSVLAQQVDKCHPGYRDIRINEEAFQQLKMLQRDPDGSIMSYFESN
jgi:hypothetical protein